MPDDPFSDGSSSDDPFGDLHDSFEDQAPEDPLGGAPGPAASGALEPSLALELARSWVREHQNATMLGAFAAGVFVGSLLRD